MYKDSNLGQRSLALNEKHNQTAKIDKLKNEKINKKLPRERARKR